MIPTSGDAMAPIAFFSHHKTGGIFFWPLDFLFYFSCEIVVAHSFDLHSWVLFAFSGELHNISPLPFHNHTSMTNRAVDSAPRERVILQTRNGCPPTGRLPRCCTPNYNPPQSGGASGHTVQCPSPPQPPGRVLPRAPAAGGTERGPPIALSVVSHPLDLS